MLDTPPEKRFDRLTRLAKHLFDVPAALICLVDKDRQWFKSSEGVAIVQTSREVSFCGHTIASDDILLVADATLDERFCDNPLVTGEPKIRFYAGCPLWTSDGSKIGTFCLLDWRPRGFSDEDRTVLKDLAHMAELEFGSVEVAQIDELTGVPNRLSFQTLAQYSLNECCSQQRPASMLFFDLDTFEAINSRFGHAEGDRALVAFSAALVGTFGDRNVVGRMAGDDFAVLFSNGAKESVGGALERLQSAVDDHNRAAKAGYTLEYTSDEVTADTSRPCAIEALLAQADALTYERKCRRPSAAR